MKRVQDAARAQWLMGVETSYYTALVSQLAPLVLAPPGPTPLHMQRWLFLLEDLIWGIFFCKAVGQQFSLRGRGIFCCIPYSVVSPLLTFAAFLELMLLGSCVFILVTALASLLHRAFTITSEVPNSQPVPNTFLHGMCLCSTACHRAFIYSVPVRYTDQVLSLGPQKRRQHEGLGTSSTGLAHELRDHWQLRCP